MSLCLGNGCATILSSECIFYEGSALPNSGINTNDSVQVALQKLDAAISAGSSGAVWGDITGDIEDQTDLISFLQTNYVSLTDPNYIFTSDVTFVLNSGKTFGKYINGQIAPWTGLTAVEAILDAATEFLPPTFSAFSMSGQSTTVEVGTTISGAKTFTWSTTNSGNVQPNTLIIRDQTNSVDLATGLADDGTEPGVNVGSVQKVTPLSHVWRIIGTDTQSNSFNRDFTVSWFWSRFHGTSASTTLNEAQIEALTSALSSGITGTYSFAAGNYKFFAWADSLGSPTASTGFRDTSTNLAVSMADSSDDIFFSNTQNGWSYGLVSVTNSHGVTTNYRVYRTKNILGGSINIQVS